MTLPRFSLSQFRVRLLFRSAFLMLMVATGTMAINVLQTEKNLSYSNYSASLAKTKAQILAKLHHPAGQLALLNPSINPDQITPLHPLLLPFSGIDFDDRYKVQQAIEMAGCLVQYPNHNAVCTAVGNNPLSGGFLYVAGNFLSSNLVPKPPRNAEFNLAHHMRVTITAQGETSRWIAPFELVPTPVANLTHGGKGASAPTKPASLPAAQQGRLTGFSISASGELLSQRPDKEFRGWIWQELTCQSPAPLADQTPDDCLKRTYFSVRLPVEVFRQAIAKAPSDLVWPPVDLPETNVHVQMWGPNAAAPLLDSNAPGATPPFALNDLQALLLPGEVLEIQKVGDARTVGPAHVTHLEGNAGAVVSEYPSLNRWINRLIQKLPSNAPLGAMEYHDLIATPLGDFNSKLTGDVRSVDQMLSTVATRIAWYLGAMLLVIVFAQVVIEISIIRRIAVLNHRAKALIHSGQDGPPLSQFTLNDLRGADELGVLAGCLSDALQRINDDVRREQIRTAQEKDLWHAVGHEIMSPLQSLLALHDSDSSSHRYLLRMQQAIRVLYGSASPSEALESSHLQLKSLDLRQLLQQVAANAPSAGIDGLVFIDHSEAPDLLVRADEYSLEDVFTHLLNNAQRWRTPGTPIVLTLQSDNTSAWLSLHNQGPHIASDHLEQIFAYGVSDPNNPHKEDDEHRGQGLFVARTYMAKMGGRIWAQNTDLGVEFVLTLELVTGRLQADFGTGHS